MSASTSSQATSSSASAPSTSSSSGTSVPSTSVAPVPSITNLVTNSVRNNEAEFLAKLSSCSSHIDAFENPAAQVFIIDQGWKWDFREHGMKFHAFFCHLVVRSSAILLREYF